MPKFPKGFGRRRSATNTPDEPSNAPVEPSFRVFERPNQSGKSFDGGLKLAQSAARPTISSRQKEDNMFEDLKVNRYVTPVEVLISILAWSCLALVSIASS